MKILVVDDSKTTRLITIRLLNSLGFTEIFEAEDGAAALDQFVDYETDVVFTDWNMPNLDGLNLLRAIRVIDKRVPVIMITTESTRHKVMEAIENGVSDYLVKLFTQAMLREKITKWVKQYA